MIKERFEKIMMIIKGTLHIKIKLFPIFTVFLLLASLFTLAAVSESQTFTLKWTYDAGPRTTTIGPLAVDVNDDGIYEVFASVAGRIVCVNGNTGELIWQYATGAISSHAPFEIQDLNNDGTPELVVSCYGCLCLLLR